MNIYISFCLDLDDGRTQSPLIGFKNVHGTSRVKQGWHRIEIARAECTPTGHFKRLKTIIIFHGDKWFFPPRHTTAKPAFISLRLNCT